MKDWEDERWDDVDFRLLMVLLKWRQTELEEERRGDQPNFKARPSRRSIARSAAAAEVEFERIEPRLLPKVKQLRRMLAASRRDEGGPEQLEEEIFSAAEAFAQILRDFARRVVTVGVEEHQGEKTLERDRVEARGLWERLRAYSSREQRFLVGEVEDFWSWSLVEILCEASIEAASDNAAKAVQFAELALAIAERLPGDEALRKWGQGWAWAHVGNAYRVHGNLPRAEHAFNRFRCLWKSGKERKPGFLDEALVLGLEASFLQAKRNFVEGLEVIEQALALASGRLVPRLLNNKAQILTGAGDMERALLILSHADSLPEAKDDPRLQRILRSSMVDCLCHLERYGEAADLMPTVWTAAPESRDELTLGRLHWLEGRVVGGLRRTKEALDNLEAARQVFLKQAIVYDAALVTLEMASLHLGEGRTAEVKNLVREMAPIFESQGVHREALAALRLFREAVQRERATAELARQMVAYLYRARNNPELRFESARIPWGTTRSRQSD